MLTTQNIKAEFVDFCYFGNIEKVKEYIKLYSGIDQDVINNGFDNACSNNQLEIVRLLLTSNSVPIHANIHYSDYNIDDLGFYEACKSGNIDIVKYLLTSPELKEKADITCGGSNWGFIIACEKGHLEVVKYLLTSNDLTTKIDLHENGNCAFKYACKYNHLELLQYITQQFDEKDCKNVEPIILSLFKEQEISLDIIRFLIFEFNMVKTSDIVDALKVNIVHSFDQKQVLNWFDIRDLNEKMSKELSIKKDSGFKIKV